MGASGLALASARAGATIGVVVAADQLTKWIAVSSLERGEQVNVFLGLDFTNVRNDGVAFGALSGGGGLLVGAIALALAGLLVYFALHASTPLLWLPVGLVLGGSLGNLADRAREGAVIDFIDPIAWPAFNLADASIVIGVGLLLYVVEGGTRGGSEPDP
jgi:signal peptidase II